MCWWKRMFIVLSKIPVSYYKQRHPTCVGRLMEENKLLLKIEMLLGDIICCTSFLSRIKMLSMMKDDIWTVIVMTIGADYYVVPVISYYLKQAIFTALIVRTVIHREIIHSKRALKRMCQNIIRSDGEASRENVWVHRMGIVACFYRT
jgi:hypothetical protein